jgi:hypothetical protein
MTAIQAEKNPAEQRLQELGVRSWAIWTKEVSSFPWHYDEQETCYFLMLFNASGVKSKLTCDPFRNK